MNHVGHKTTNPQNSMGEYNILGLGVICLNARINSALGINNCTNIHLMLSSWAKDAFTLGC
jgi:hypothetical protein